MRRMSPQYLLYVLRAKFSPVKLSWEVNGGPCLVLASAPDPTYPAGLRRQASLWSVNASQAYCAKLGLPQPDVSVISGQMLGDQPVNIEAKRALRGLATNHLIV